MTITEKIINRLTPDNFVRIIETAEHISFKSEFVCHFKKEGKAGCPDATMRLSDNCVCPELKIEGNHFLPCVVEIVFAPKHLNQKHIIIYNIPKNNVVFSSYDFVGLVLSQETEEYCSATCEGFNECGNDERQQIVSFEKGHRRNKIEKN